VRYAAEGQTGLRRPDGRASARRSLPGQEAYGAGLPGQGGPARLGGGALDPPFVYRKSV